MELSKNKIKNGKTFLAKLGVELEDRCRMHGLCADPTRLKILYLLSRYRDACPSELAAILGINISSVSYQLRLMKLGKLVEKKKIGKSACCTISKQGRKIMEEINFD